MNCGNHHINHAVPGRRAIFREPAVWLFRLLLALILLPLPVTCADVELSQYVHNVWQTENGLPNNSVHCIVQDKTGYIWLGTENGVVRFDGVKFEIFDESNTPGLKSSFIYRLVAAADGSIWGGTRGGGVFHYTEGAFIPYNTNNGLSNAHVWSMAQTSDGAIWAATRHGLNRIRNDRATTFGLEDGLPDDYVTALAPDEQGGIWAGTDNGRVAWFDPKEEHFKVLPPAPAVMDTEIKALAYDPSTKRLWISHDGDGVYYYEDGVYHRVDFEPDEEVERIQSLMIDHLGAVWAGTLHHGLIRWRDGRFSRFSSANGLSYDHVGSIMEGREGNIWVGTVYGGLNRLREGRVKTFGKPEGLPDENVTTVLEGEPNVLYIGSTSAGVTRYKDSVFTPIGPLVGERKNIRALAWVDGVLWIGSAGGLAKYDKAGMHLFNPGDGVPGADCTALYRDSKNRLWAGTFDGKVFEILPGDEFRALQSGPFEGQYVRCFVEDDLGQIWAGFQRGLGRVSGRNILPWEFPIEEEVSPRCFYVEPGALWVGTRDHGLFKISGSSTINIDYHAGLNRSPIYQILPEGTNLWFSGNRGIERISIKDLAAFGEGKIPQVPTQLLNERDGMRTSDCNGGFTPSGCVTRSGKVWFATKRGVAMIDPNRFPVNHIPPPVLVSAVFVDGVKQDAIESKARLPGNSRLEFNYTALSFSSPSLVQFKYKLEGLDKAWIGPVQRREAVYYNLPPGTYRFHVTACNEDMLWNPQGASVSFTIPPRFHQTILFYILVLSAGGLAIRGVHIWRVRQIALRNQQLESLVAQRTVQLQKQIEKRNEAETTLLRVNDQLEDRVAERTEQLRKVNETLRVELQERLRAQHALAESEARLRRVVDSQMVGILFWDQAGYVSDANHAFLSMVGYSREDLEAGRIFWKSLTPPEHLPKDAAALEEIRRQGFCTPFEKEYIRKDGVRFPVFLGGACMDNDFSRGVCFVLDITERKAAENKVHELNASLEARVRQRTSELALANSRLEAEVNERRRVAVALSAFSQLGQKLQSARTEKEAAGIIADIANKLIPHESCVIELHDREGRLYPVINQQHSAPPEYLSSISVPIRNESHSIGVMALYSCSEESFSPESGETLQALADYCAGALDRIHAEQARVELERELRKLPQRILHAQEGERRRVARELHDGVNQALASIKFRLHSAETLILRGDQKWRELTHKSKEMLDSVLEQVRRLSRNLRPGELDDFGLLPAVRSACEELERRSGLEIRLSSDGIEQRLHQSMELALYRVIQEALTNIEKHSQASTVSILLTSDGSYVTLEICDNGKGFPAGAAGASKGLGLIHMRERASLIGGVFSIKSAPGEGVRLTVHAPVHLPAALSENHE